MPAATPTETFTRLKPSEILVEDGFNPRSEMDKRKLQELADSIAEHGIIEPLIFAEPDEKGKHKLVAGGRRFAAGKLAKVKEYPALIRSMNGAEKTIAVIENLQREDLNPIDEANGFAAVMEAEGIKSQKQLAERLGVSTSQVSDRLKLLKLDPAVQRLFADGSLPAVAGGLLEKAQRFNDRFAQCLALVLADDDEIDASRMGEYDQARTAFAKAAALAVNGPKGEDSECDCAVPMREGYINFTDVRVKWPAEANTLKTDLKGYGWYAAWEKADVDACRAYGCLFEHKCKAGDDTVTIAYAFDASFVVDLLQKKHDKKVAEDKKAAEKVSKGSTGRAAAAADRKREEEERKARAKAIEQENVAIVSAITSKLPGMQIGLEHVKAICQLALAAEEPTGSQLIKHDPTCAELVAAATEAGQDVDWALMVNLQQRIEGAKTIEEVLRITSAAILAQVWEKRMYPPSGGRLLGLVNEDWDQITNLDVPFQELGNKLRLFEATGDDPVEIKQPDVEQVQDAAAEHAAAVATEGADAQ